MKKKLLVLLLSTSSCVFAGLDKHNLDDSFVNLTPKVSTPFNKSNVHAHMPVSFEGIKDSIIYEHSLDDSLLVLKPTSSENFDFANDQESTQIIVDKSFAHSTVDYAEMIDLSYRLVKGHNEESTRSLENLFEKGFNIKGFSGLSGNNGANHDLQGFIAFNKLTGEAVVTFHGSQDSYDWENNFDGRKVSALENGLKFEGGVHKGINDRYQSSKQDIYDLLDAFYDQLDNKDLFHITTTGHSLGGGMTALCYADLATDYMNRRFGEHYNNNAHNRVRGYAVSAPRVFDDIACEDLNNSAGIKNIVLDFVDGDPVTQVGPGKSTTKWFENSSKRGFTAGVLKIAKWLGHVPTSNPGKVAQLFGGFEQFGTKAPVASSEISKLSKVLDLYDTEAQLASGAIKNEGTFKKIENYFTKKIAHLHYGKLNTHGGEFESRFLAGDKLGERINNKINTTTVQPVTASSKGWWGKIKGLVTTTKTAA